jgi:tRNA(Met) C34 N-acetyltransferase TmcA
MSRQTVEPADGQFVFDQRGRAAGRRTINIMLYGRDGEQAAIERLLEGVRAGLGGVLVVRGDPGIGKSALLGFAVSSADDFRVLRAAGVEAESGLAYATLHQLLHPVLDGWNGCRPRRPAR